MSEQTILEKQRELVAELESDDAWLHGMWMEYGAEYGDRMMECSAELTEARAVLARLEAEAEA